MPVDIIYGTSEEDPAVDYDGYAGALQEKMVTAYEEVRKELRAAAQRYKRCYDVKVRPHHYEVGQWVYYFNPRKYARRQDKRVTKFSRPFLVIAIPTPVNVVIQRSSRVKPMTVHLDKVKLYTGPEQVSWLKPVATGPPDNENVTTPSAGRVGQPAGSPENRPLETVEESSPRIRLPDVRPKRARRPPGYLAGYERKNQTAPDDVVGTD